MSVIRNFLRNEKIMFLAKVTPFLNLKIANYYIAHPNLKRDSPIINFKIYLLSLQYLRWDYFWLGRHFQIWILSLLSYWDINQKSDRLKVQFWTLEHKLQSFNPPPQKLQKEIDSRSVPSSTYVFEISNCDNSGQESRNDIVYKFLVADIPLYQKQQKCENQPRPSNPLGSY